MFWLILQMAFFLAAAAALSLALGWLIWGWGGSNRATVERSISERELAEARRAGNRDAAAVVSAESRIEKLEAELAEARRGCDDRDLRIDRLMAELKVMDAEAAFPGPDHAQDHAQDLAPDLAPTSAPAVVDAADAAAEGGVTAPGNLYAEPPGDPEDLKLIKGIGPVMESILNKLGIHHYRQLAAFSRTDVEWISREIDTFPDRIMRDRWVEQAAELHFARHGAPHDA